MKRNTLKAAVILGMMCSLPSAAAEEALVSFKALTPRGRAGISLAYPIASSWRTRSQLAITSRRTAYDIADPW
jgi:hypothetical protein